MIRCCCLRSRACRNEINAQAISRLVPIRSDPYQDSAQANTVGGGAGGEGGFAR